MNDQRHEDLAALKKLKEDMLEEERIRKEISGIIKHINTPYSSDSYDTAKGTTVPENFNRCMGRIEKQVSEKMSSGFGPLKVISTIIVIAMVVWSIVVMYQNTDGILIIPMLVDVTEGNEGWFMGFMYVLDAIIGGALIFLNFVVCKE